MSLPPQVNNAIVEGIAKLIALRLKGSPSEDTADGIYQVWLEVFEAQNIVWDDELDAGRIKKAFITCAGAVDWFPAPKAVLAFMPKREASKQLEHKPVYAPMPEAIREKIRELTGGAVMVKKQSMNRPTQVPRTKDELLDGLKKDYAKATTSEQRQRIQKIIDGL